MSKSAKVYLVYAGLGLIPVFLGLILPAQIDGETLHVITNLFPYPLYMGFALVGYLCFKLNQNRFLFSVLLLLGIVRRGSRSAEPDRLCRDVRVHRLVHVELADAPDDRRGEVRRCHGTRAV